VRRQRGELGQRDADVLEADVPYSGVGEEIDQ
jgi:hypothetical protein